MRAMAFIYLVNHSKYFSIKRFPSREKLMWMFIIKVVMLAAILFLKLLFSVILLFSYSLIKFCFSFVLVSD